MNTGKTGMNFRTNLRRIPFNSALQTLYTKKLCRKSELPFHNMKEVCIRVFDCVGNHYGIRWKDATCRLDDCQFPGKVQWSDPNVTYSLRTCEVDLHP